LLAGDDFYLGLIGETPLGPRGKPKPDTVISAKRVAAGEDQASGWWLGHR
jgi:hypothetical protein